MKKTHLEVWPNFTHLDSWTQTSSHSMDILYLPEQQGHKHRPVIWTYSIHLGSWNSKPRLIMLRVRIYFTQYGSWNTSCPIYEHTLLSLQQEQQSRSVVRTYFTHMCSWNNKPRSIVRTYFTHLGSWSSKPRSIVWTFYSPGQLEQQTSFRSMDTPYFVYPSPLVAQCLELQPDNKILQL